MVPLTCTNPLLLSQVSMESSVRFTSKYRNGEQLEKYKLTYFAKKYCDKLLSIKFTFQLTLCVEIVDMNRCPL